MAHKILDRDFRKEMMDFLTESRIKECFHYQKSKCKGGINSAHSLQKNGVLSLIQYEVNKSMRIYSFRDLNGQRDKSGLLVTASSFVPLGKKQASTFYGFCNYHDTKVFIPIENNEVDIESDEHCFLLSYRACAKEYHSNIEVLNGFKKNNLYPLIKGAKLAVRELLNLKNKLNDALRAEDYSVLNYFIYTIDSCIPIACSTTITPSYSYCGTILNKSSSSADVYQNIILTILPTKTETHIIFAYCSEDKKSVKFISELESLTDSDLENAVTSILISDVENTFISPLIWERMSFAEQQSLMNELTITQPYYPIEIDDFLKSTLNLFSNRFSVG